MVLLNDTHAASLDSADDADNLVRRYNLGNRLCVSSREAAENEYTVCCSAAGSSLATATEAESRLEEIIGAVNAMCAKLQTNDQNDHPGILRLPFKGLAAKNATPTGLSPVA